MVTRNRHLTMDCNIIDKFKNINHIHWQYLCIILEHRAWFELEHWLGPICSDCHIEAHNKIPVPLKTKRWDDHTVLSQAPAISMVEGVEIFPFNDNDVIPSDGEFATWMSSDWGFFIMDLSCCQAIQCNIYYFIVYNLLFITSVGVLCIARACVDSLTFRFDELELSRVNSTQLNSTPTTNGSLHHCYKK